jgi:hypothetical protein
MTKKVFNETSLGKMTKYVVASGKDIEKTYGARIQHRSTALRNGSLRPSDKFLDIFQKRLDKRERGLDTANRKLSKISGLPFEEEAGGMCVGAGAIPGIGGSTNGPGTGDSKMSAWLREPGVSKKNQHKHTVLRREDFASSAVFEVDSHTFHNARLEKRKFKRWKTYLDEDDALSEVREYARHNPHKPIILKNGRTGEMMVAKYGKKGRSKAFAK